MSNREPDLTDPPISNPDGDSLILYPTGPSHSNMEPVGATRFLTLFAVCAIFPLIFILAYSAMGFGVRFGIWSRQYKDNSNYLLCALLTIASFLYLLDAHRWKSVVGKALRSIFLFFFLGGGAFWTGINDLGYPNISLCIYSIYMPFWLYECKRLFFSKSSPHEYVFWISGPLFAVAAVMTVSWLYWINLGQKDQWLFGTKDAIITYSEEIGCKPDFSLNTTAALSCFDPTNNQTCYNITKFLEDGTEQTGVSYSNTNGCNEECSVLYHDCLLSFTLWIWPLTAAMSMLFLANVSMLLRPQHLASPVPFLKIWITMFLSMWIAAEVTGVGTGLRKALSSFIVSLVLSATVLAIGTINLQEQSEWAWGELSSNYENVLEIMKALLLFANVPMLFYLSLSFVNQNIRKTLASYSGSTARPQGYFTEITSNQLKQMACWNWVKVIRNAIIWGSIYMAVVIFFAGKFTLLFLSWIAEITENMSLVTVSLILFSLGLVLLLLIPPLPGVPLYVANGIILGRLALEKNGWELPETISYLITFGLILKLLACALQQKLIGEKMSHYVYIRQYAKINSGPLRAAKFIVLEKKLSFGKVAYLIGCPDWPVSVLCGIMRVDLLPILVATIPVVVVIIPTTLSGLFLYLNGNPQYPWAGEVLSYCLFATTVVCTICAVGAFTAVGRTMSQRKSELEGMDYDEAVREADLILARKKSMFYEVNSWRNLSFTAKFFLGLSFLFMAGSVYLNIFAGSLLFEYWEITYTIKKNLNRNVFNFFNPLGWLDLGLLLLSLVFLKIFDCLAYRNVSFASIGLEESLPVDV